MKKVKFTVPIEIGELTLLQDKNKRLKKDFDDVGVALRNEYYRSSDYRTLHDNIGDILQYYFGYPKK